MGRTLVIGDLHGGLKALQQVMKRARVTKNDTLIFLGDYVDGWSDSVATLDFLIDLKQEQNCVFIKGNHDDLLLKWLSTQQENKEWFLHGGASTAAGYEKANTTTKQAHITFLENLENYHLDSENRLFVHAGFTNVKGVLHEYFKAKFYWDRTLWECVLALDDRISKDDLRYPKRLLLYREIYIGHTPVIRFGYSEPYEKANVINMDTGAAFTGKISLMDIDTKHFWQSDAVMDLYPDEIGRN